MVITSENVLSLHDHNRSVSMVAPHTATQIGEDGSSSRHHEFVVVLVNTVKEALDVARKGATL